MGGSPSTVSSNESVALSPWEAPSLAASQGDEPFLLRCHFLLVYSLLNDFFLGGPFLLVHSLLGGPFVLGGLLRLGRLPE